ncbi:MAG: hypothetical protein ACWGHH_06550 [Sulfurovaceae bacterium]
MTKAVSNLTSTDIVLGGATVKSLHQETIREELITQDEIKVIQEIGVIRFEHMVITVMEALQGQGGNNAQNKPSGDDAKDEQAVVHVAYPKDCITKEGLLSASNKVVSVIKALDELYDNLLDDKSFMEMYPPANIDDFRVELPEKEEN